MYIINTTGNRWYILCPNDLIHTRWFYDTPKDLYVALRMKSKHQIYENAIKKKSSPSIDIKQGRVIYSNN